MESGVLSSNYPSRKDAPEDKDPPEGNGSCLSKVITSSSWSIASCNTDVSSVLKQAKRSFTKIVIWIASYEANSSTEIWNLATSSQPSRAHYNPTIIQREQKFNSIRQSFAHQTFWHASFIRQISSDFSTVKVLRYTVIITYCGIIYVTGFAKTCIVHTSIFSNLATYKTL